MTYDTNLARTVRRLLDDRWPGLIEEKKMFGGLGFLLDERMFLAVSGDGLILKIGPEAASFLDPPQVVPMQTGTRVMREWARVITCPEADAARWVDLAVASAHVAADEPDDTRRRRPRRPTGRRPQGS
jgi:TfoX/Sxy family transcriptional regulator of competence genes